MSDKKQLAVGFARFVIKQGHGAKCTSLGKDGQPMTWQARGREIYGAELFNEVMREEIARAKQETGNAEKRLSAVRGDQREVREEDAARRGEDAGGEDHEQPRGSSAAVASGTSAS